MAAGIAHEINNPLSGVIGFSEMLMERDVPQDIAQDLKVVNENAQRVATIVRNMLTFARPHSEGKQYADINSIISRVLEVQAYELKTGNIQVTTKLSPDLPWTLVDEGQIQQVLLNIITNAEQTMRHHCGKGQLSVSSQNQDGKIQVAIADNGQGIAAENLEKIFEPFFTTKEPGEGTGLGLSISYSIIREHGGRLYAKSKPGHGTTLFIELPVMTEPR
jgi:signal transduction histidine kinase